MNLVIIRVVHHSYNHPTNYCSCMYLPLHLPDYRVEVSQKHMGGSGLLLKLGRNVSDSGYLLCPKGISVPSL
jgi:hypothetical protein